MDMMCNKLKHNQNRLVPVVGMSNGELVIGLSIYEIERGGMLRPNRIIHSEREAFSFSTEIRRLLADAYLTAHEIGQYVENLPGPRQEPAPQSAPTGRLELIERVARLPSHVFVFEARKHMPIWDFDGTKLTIGGRGGPVSYLAEPVRMIVEFQGDGVTRQFKVPL
jgi:hypothetical protein